MITRCGYGFIGCVPPTDDERVRRYARALGRDRIVSVESGEWEPVKYEPHAIARRCERGLARIPWLRKLWKRVDRRKAIERRKALREKARKATPKPSNVVLLRKRRA